MILISSQPIVTGRKEYGSVTCNITPLHGCPAYLPSAGVNIIGRADTLFELAACMELNNRAVSFACNQGAPAIRKGVAVPLPSLQLVASRKHKPGSYQLQRGQRHS